ncbi:epithelial-stromal interaction protein 1 isoform X2 [Danio rerio]|uniref:Epithelial-stromal interaction protein 1 isoform X2 n=1 Tax=Danio rerio TaxID=7955 RepID=A0AC58GG20_DANRE
MNHYKHPRRNAVERGGYRRHTINQRNNMTDSGQTNNNECPNSSPGTSNPQNQPEHAGGFTKIPPNESRRSKLLSISQKGEENLRRLKEENRPGPIHLPPERLGGNVSLEEVRQKQWVNARNSKIEKKVKKEEMDKMKRQAEEETNEKMKAKQREKANKLEMRKKQEDERRKQQHQQDKQKKTEEFLQRFERSSSTVSMAASNSIPASPWTKCHEYRESRRAEENASLLKMQEEQRRKAAILEEKQKQQEEDRKRQTEADHRRVNSAFLDRLEASGSGVRVSEPVTQTLESSNVWLEEDDEPQDTALSTSRNPSQVHTDSAEEDAPLETSPLRRSQSLHVCVMLNRSLTPVVGQHQTLCK